MRLFLCRRDYHSRMECEMCGEYPLRFFVCKNNRYTPNEKNTAVKTAVFLFWKGIYILIENMPIGSNRGLWVQTDTHRFKSRVIGSTQKINSTWYSTIPKKIEIC